MITNDLDTGSAARYTLSPLCVAVTVHVPMSTTESVVPETLHVSGVSEAKATVSPDEDDADNVVGAARTVLPASATNVTVWADFVVTNVRTTAGAAR